MRFEWYYYLDLAHELAESANTNINQEAALRCAISRAYYAAFCESRNYLRDIKNISSTSSQNAHQFVSDEFLKSNDKVIRSIGVKLSRLRMIRNAADYKDIFQDLDNQAVFALKNADSIVSDIDNLYIPIQQDT
jgi:uncharacterized protein (UPF0332 family)